jgi:hypothetical protein
MGKRGRPQNDDVFFVVELQRVMRVFDCGWREACRKIAFGVEVPNPPINERPEKDWQPIKLWSLSHAHDELKFWSDDPPNVPRWEKVTTKGSPWQRPELTGRGRERYIAKLEKRYYRYLKRERQKK